MAPSATETATQVVDGVKEKAHPHFQSSSPAVDLTEPESEPKLETGHKNPLAPSGLLDKYKHFDVTPVLGREFIDVDLVEWLRAPDSDDLIRELAVTSRWICFPGEPCG